ncbi:MAG TPA: hypothetical protein PK530_17090, partial [Anaerolineales bacterium]|nr:hypothetical protein [Anaerolineales bacterium]
PIHRTVASEAKGIADLADAIARHRAHLIQTGDLERRERARMQNELDLRIQETLVNRWRAGTTNGQYEDVLEKLVKRELSPEDAASELVNKETIP